jgi:hypothetical protein
MTTTFGSLTSAKSINSSYTGDGGYDIVDYNLPQWNYTITTNSNGSITVKNHNTGITDTLTGISEIDFQDGGNLDLYITPLQSSYSYASGNNWASLYMGAPNQTITVNGNANVTFGLFNGTAINLGDGNNPEDGSVAFYNLNGASVNVNMVTGTATDSFGHQFTFKGFHNVNTGGGQNDIYLGTPQSDDFWVNFGNPGGQVLIQGNGGDDTASFFSNLFSDYTLSANADASVITVSKGGYTATLENISTLQFSQNGVGQPITLQAMSLINFNTVGASTLLAHTNDGWEGNNPGKAITLPYSFMTAPPSAGEGSSGTGFSEPSAAYKSAVQQILTQISSETLITFNAVSDTSTTHGQLDFGVNTQTGSLGASYLPTDPKQAGQVWLDSSALNSLSPGGIGYQALLTQIAHALGLSSPISTTSPASSQSVLLSQWNNNDFTVMSANQAPNDLWQSAMGPLDVQALQTLYGTNPAYNTSSQSAQVFKMSDLSGQSIQTLSSTGSGMNVLDCSSVSRGVYINLGANTYSSIGIDANGITSFDNVFIGTNTKIQKVIGTADDDVMIGNTLNDIFVTGNGNDVVLGGTGLNTVVLNQAYSTYAISFDAPSSDWLVSDKAGVSGSKSFNTVQRLQFTDVNLALDMGTNQAGGETAEILGAIFGKASVSNQSFVGIGLNALDSGTSFLNLMQVALNFKLGAGFSNAQEITLLYQNLLGAVAQTSDINQWSAVINSGQYTQASLAVMAAQTSLNTNNINLTGLAQTGLEYTPSTLY